MTLWMRDHWLLLLGALALTLVTMILAGCSDSAGAIDEDGRLEIVMEDYAFETDDLTVPAGRPLTITIVNRDEVSHPLSFGRGLLEEEARPAGYAEGLLTGLDARVTPTAAVLAPEPPDRSSTVQVPGGETITIEVTLPEDRVGTWEVGCFLGRGCHYEAGLAATLTVTTG
jgi:plastocyanin